MVLTRREYMAQFVNRDDSADCGSGGGDTGSTGLRIASVFIIMTGSMFGALFPVLARRTRWLSPMVPKGVFDFAKYFGSGVIVSSRLPKILKLLSLIMRFRLPLRSSICSTPPPMSLDLPVSRPDGPNT